MNKKLNTLLDLNPKATLAIRGFFDNYSIEQFYIKNDSALLFGTSDHLWVHLVGTSENDIASLLSEHHAKTPYYYSVEDWIIPLILEHGEEEWRMETLRYVLDPDVELPEAGCITQKLDLSFAEFVHDNSDYKDYTDLHYIHDRLSKDISAAIMIDGKPVAWGFTHDDGALGFLHVLPEHRKKGYARDISLALIAQKRKLKKPVFCNIVPGNTASINLTESQGFEFDRKVYWLKMKEE